MAPSVPQGLSGHSIQSGLSGRSVQSGPPVQQASPTGPRSARSVRSIPSVQLSSDFQRSVPLGLPGHSILSVQWVPSVSLGQSVRPGQLGCLTDLQAILYLRSVQ